MLDVVRDWSGSSCNSSPCAHRYSDGRARSAWDGCACIGTKVGQTMTSIGAMGAIRTVAATTAPQDADPGAGTDPASTAGAETSAGNVPEGAFGAAIDNSLHAASDAAKMAGVDWDRKQVTPNALATAGLFGGATALQTMRQVAKVDAPMSTGLIASNVAPAAMNTAIKVTPNLVAAVAGPAVADGVSYLLPNLVPRYKSTGHSLADTQQKNRVGTARGVAGAAAVAVAGATTWLIKPSLFKKNLFANTERYEAAAVEMTRNGTFANRVAIGLVGGIAATLLLNRAVGKTDPTQRRNAMLETAGVGVATAAAIAGAGLLTRGAGKAGLTAVSNGLIPFQKPTKAMLGEMVKVVAPLGSLAYLTSSKYFNTFDNLGNITGTYGR